MKFTSQMGEPGNMGPCDGCRRPNRLRRSPHPTQTVPRGPPRNACPTATPAFSPAPGVEREAPAPDPEAPGAPARRVAPTRAVRLPRWKQVFAGGSTKKNGSIDIPID